MSSQKACSVGCSWLTSRIKNINNFLSASFKVASSSTTILCLETNEMMSEIDFLDNRFKDFDFKAISELASANNADLCNNKRPFALHLLWLRRTLITNQS